MVFALAPAQHCARSAVTCNEFQQRNGTRGRTDRGDLMSALWLTCRADNSIESCSGLCALYSFAEGKLFGVLERVKGIEPSSSAWKAVALPLSYTRVRNQ